MKTRITNVDRGIWVILLPVALPFILVGAILWLLGYVSRPLWDWAGRVMDKAWPAERESV